MGGVERLQPLPGGTIRCVAVLGARSAVFEPQPSSSARGTGGGAGATRTRRGSGKGGASPAGQLSKPDCRAALEEFPLEKSRRRRPLSRRTFESRRPLQQIDSGRICLDADG